MNSTWELLCCGPRENNPLSFGEIEVHIINGEGQRSSSVHWKASYRPLVTEITAERSVSNFSLTVGTMTKATYERKHSVGT